MFYSTCLTPSVSLLIRQSTFSWPHYLEKLLRWMLHVLILCFIQLFCWLGNSQVLIFDRLCTSLDIPINRHYQTCFITFWLRENLAGQHEPILLLADVFAFCDTYVKSANLFESSSSLFWQSVLGEIKAVQAAFLGDVVKWSRKKSVKCHEFASLFLY